LSADGSIAVGVIDTNTFKAVATIPIVSRDPESPWPPFGLGIAAAPDGKHIYTLTSGVKLGGTVSAVDTATNVIVATYQVGRADYPLGTMGLSPYIPFAAFNATLDIAGRHKSIRDRFVFHSNFTLGKDRNGIDPVADPVTIQIGTFAATIPPGSFKKVDGKWFSAFQYQGVIDGVSLNVLIEPTGAKRYALQASAAGDPAGTATPVTVRVSIGVDSGTVLVKAKLLADTNG
jgi:hypothetical protein